MTLAPAARSENRLLAALPAADFARITALTTDTTFKLRDVVFRPNGPINHVYFPRTGALSAILVMADGTAVEVGTVGREGFAGVPIAHGADRSPTEVICQIAPCDCRRMPAAAFRAEADRPGPFRAVIQRYAQAYLNQVSQSAACNGLHPVEERCARWLLITHDRVGADDFVLTQEFLGIMLGVRRATVTTAAGVLQRAGLIRYVRGRMTVLDRPGLEKAACECYHVVRTEYERLLP